MAKSFYNKPSSFSDTSWEQSSKWYDQVVGQEGHYYHQKIVLPNILKILNLKNADANDKKLLDLACGQGILSRHIPNETAYHGIDASASLIKNAQKYSIQKHHLFSVGDICKPLPLKEHNFTHATLILAVQNIKDPLLAFSQARKHLKDDALFIIVMNHPCFRIPRQSQWEVDETQKIQYRRINRYFSSLEIPLQTNPSQKENSQELITFHYPLSTYTKWLHQSGFKINYMDEWTSDKISVGKNARMENRAREEFPLFLAIIAQAQN